MNCSESRFLLSRLWRELRGGARAPDNSSSAAAAEGEDDAYLYILLIMIFYGCLAGGLILAYTRSRKLESNHDPYHLYIERDWTDSGGGAGSRGRGKGRTETTDPSLEEGATPQGERRRSSGDEEPAATLEEDEVDKAARQTPRCPH